MQKKYFLITILVVFVICIMEVLSIVLDGASIKFRWLHILSNYVGFTLTPTVFIFLANAIVPNKNTKLFFFISILYAIWGLISLIISNGCGIFYVNELNQYSRAKGFFVYTIFYSFGILYFFIENIRLSAKFWHANNIILLANMVFITVGTTIQILYPKIQVTWLCVIISIVIYYIYHGTLYQQLDEQTYLMNYNSFKKWIRNQKKEAVIVIAEIDNFSKLKLNYNRSKLDEIIKDVSKSFNDFYKKYGTCYRLDSEEFCAVFSNVSLDFDEINKDFFIDYVKANFNMEELPLIALGYAKISPKQDLTQVLSAADIKKRDFIKERINYLY